MHLVRALTLLASSGLISAAFLVTHAHADSTPDSISALMLSVSPAEAKDLIITDARAVLVCSPIVTGDHPAADDACYELSEVNGSIEELEGPDYPCTMEYQPVTATAYGVWEGTPVSYSETFPNYCILLSARGTVFDF